MGWGWKGRRPLSPRKLPEHGGGAARGIRLAAPETPPRLSSCDTGKPNAVSGAETRRSLYDEEDEGAPWFLRPSDEDDEGPAAEHRSNLADWAAAERACLRPLADVARLLGRLEQRLETRGGADRLALIEASDLLWLEGVRIKPERLWMYQADGGVAPVVDRADYALGLWMVDRLVGAWPLQDEDSLARFLGRRRTGGADADLPAVTGLRSAEDIAGARAEWLAAKDASADLHPLTQAAFLAERWRRAGAGGRECDVEAAVIAAKIAAEDGLAFAPLAIGGKRRIFGAARGAGDAAAILSRFLEAAAGGAQRALLELARRDDWRARADAAPLKKNPAALVALLDRNYAISTGQAEAYLGSVRQTALTSLNILRGHGLVREITGGKSFFCWTADFMPKGRPLR